MKSPLRLWALALGLLLLGAGEPAGDRWPLPPGSLSRGWRPGHAALDLAAPCGTPFVAARAGRVVKVVDQHRCRRCYGCLEGCRHAYKRGPCKNNEIWVEHADGSQARYLHLRASAVRLGDAVEAGQVLGQVGDVGWTCGRDGCHLHLEWWGADGQVRRPPLREPAPRARAGCGGG